MAEISIGKADLEPGTLKCLMVKDKKLALSNIGGKYFCMDNACSHVGGPICEGTIEEDGVVCPWHGSKFDYKTGDVLGGPAAKPLKVYKVKEKKGELFIDI